MKQDKLSLKLYKIRKWKTKYIEIVQTQSFETSLHFRKLMKNHNNSVKI